MYNQTHQEKTGEITMIAELKNQHLKNIVEMHLRNLKAAKDVIDCDTKVSKFEQVLYGFDPKMNEKQARKIIDNSMAMLPSYIMECMIRGFDYGSKLRDILGRATCEVTNPFSLFQQTAKELPSVDAEPEPVFSFFDDEDDKPF